MRVYYKAALMNGSILFFADLAFVFLYNIQVSNTHTQRARPELLIKIAFNDHLIIFIFYQAKIIKIVYGFSFSNHKAGVKITAWNVQF